MEQRLHEIVTGPAVAVDTIVFGIDDHQLKVLLLQVNSGPYNGKWALPGGLVHLGESPEAAAIRVLKNKTNIRSGYLEQLYTFGNPNRDIRGQVISVAHLLLVEDLRSYVLTATEYYQDIRWQPVDNLPPTAFDHASIVEFAHHRLKGKMGYSNIAASFLPKNFTLEQLKDIYETVQTKEYSFTDFKKKILAMKVLSPSERNLYHFTNETLVYFD